MRDFTLLSTETTFHFSSNRDPDFSGWKDCSLEKIGSTPKPKHDW